MFEQLREFAIGRHNVRLPELIVCDGKIHRFDPDSGSTKKGDAGWYLGREFGGIPWVVYGDFRIDNKHLGKWFGNENGKITRESGREINKALRAAEREAEKNHRKAVSAAVKLWEGASAADPQHPYIVAKAITPHSARQNGDEILILARDAQGDIGSVQRIMADGSKRFVFGSRMAGLWGAVGYADGVGHADDDAPVVYITEGWATACTIHDATDAPVYIAFSAGNLPAIAEIVRARHETAQIIIAADNDCWKNGTDDMRDPVGNVGLIRGQQAAIACGGELRAIPVTPDKLASGRHPTDFNDWAELHGLDGVRHALGCAAPKVVTIDNKPFKQLKDWRSDFLLNEDGEIRAKSLANGRLAFQNDERVKGIYRFNELDQCIYKKNARICEHDYLKATVWLERDHGITLTENQVFSIIRACAAENRFNPVTEYLDALIWDGIPRLEHMLADLLGVEETTYAANVGRCFMISAVARAYRPGCKVDTVLVLEGKQGKNRKSTFIRKLFGDSFFSDSLPDIRHKDTAIQIASKWCFEISELDALERRDSEEIKSWLSRQVEHYRPPYGRETIEQPRRCVFVGTTNRDDYLKDPTGGRRYWPVLCREFNHEGIELIRDQLWAETVTRFKNGEKWWLTEDAEKEAEEQQANRLMADSWDEIIRNYVEFSSTVTTAVIMSDCLSIPKEKWNRTTEMRVGNILRALGFIRERARETGRRVYKFVRTASISA